MPKVVLNLGRYFLASRAVVLLGLGILLILACNLGTVTHNEQATGNTIAYETIRKYPIPNGGYNRVLVIAPQYCNDHDIRLLGNQLKNELQSQPNAFVFIYNDARAASMRQQALQGSLSISDLSFHDQHMLASYTKNGNTGFNRFTFWLQGMNGPQVIVDY